MNPPPADDDDRGAVLVLVALMVGVLLGVGALVLDAGALYSERRQLQNGADAAALAVAADCAEGDCGSATSTADTYADHNVKDGSANVDEVCGVGPGLPSCAAPAPGSAGASGWVQVRTSTHNPTSTDATQVRFVLAPLLDAAHIGRTVRASAVVAWGPVGSAIAIPVGFSVCEFEAMGGSLDGLTFPDTPGYVYLHGDGPDHSCPGNPSGGNLPGGFGWLGSTDCQVEVVVDQWASSDTGNDVPCDPAVWRDTEVLIPLYDDIRSTGTNGEYHIIGFAGFRMLGYYLGATTNWNLASCPQTAGSSGRCLYGEFTYVTTTGEIGFGDVDFGARTISVIG